MTFAAFGGESSLRRLTASLDGVTVPSSPYHDRACSPEDTFAAMRRMVGEVGVTRVGLLTDLDVVGIPVAFATRPNSRSLSVFQGKGMDVPSAMASAMMEAFETAVAEALPENVRVGSLARFVRDGHRIVDLDRTARCVPDRIDAAREAAWCQGLDLVGGGTVLVPWELAGLDHREPRTAGFEQSSDGLASGNTPAEAVFHGLCELIERDAWTLLLLRSNDELAAMRTDPRLLGDPVLDTFVDRIERAGFELFLADMTSDVAVPAYAAILMPKRLPRACDVAWSQVCGGYGCHPLPARAAIRAVTEAAQSRLTLIAGSRDDLAQRRYSASGTGSSDMAETLALGSAPCGRSHPAAFGAEGESIQNRVRALVGRLRRLGIGEVIAVPLGHDALGAAVVRMIVPGLEVALDGANVQLGLRAARQVVGIAA